MPFLAEMADVGLLKLSETTRRFLQDYRDAVNSGDYTSIEHRAGADDALQELKDAFADGITCQQLKDFLWAMGLFGCARSKRVKAVGAQLGFTDKELEECLKEQEDDGPRTYYLPPGTGIPHPSFPKGCFEPGLREDERAIFCPPTLEFHKDVPRHLVADECSPIMHVSHPQDALCPTDRGYGCGNGDDEDTEDLPEGPDCDSANSIIRAMSDTVLNPGGGRQLFTPATYLDVIYRTLAINDRMADRGCTTVAEHANTLIKGIMDSIPDNYIPSHLLPPNWYETWRAYPDTFQGISEYRIGLTPDRVYKQIIIGPDGTIIEYSGTSDPEVTPSPAPPEPAPPTFPDYDGLTPDEYAANYRENVTDALEAGVDIIHTLMNDIDTLGISQREAAPWIHIIQDAINNARELAHSETEQLLADHLRRLIDAAATFRGNPLRELPPELVAPGIQED